MPQAGGDKPAPPAGEAPQLPRKQILMVIAHPCRTGPIAEALAGVGFEVTVVRGWSRALESIQQVQPSLVLFCSAPDTGLIRTLRGMTRAPIMSLLVDGAESDRVDALIAGADDCQPTTVESGEIVMRVRGLLRRSEWQQQRGAGPSRRAA